MPTLTIPITRRELRILGHVARQRKQSLSQVITAAALTLPYQLVEISERGRNLRLLPDGRIRVDVSVFKRGRRFRRRATVRTPEEAHRTLLDLRCADYDALQALPPPPTTFEEVAKEWLAAKVNIRPSSRLTLRACLKHLIGVMRGLPIALTDPRPIERARDELLRKLKPRYVNVCLQHAGAIWRFAMARQYATMNPVACVERPRKNAGEIADLSAPLGLGDDEAGAVDPSTIYTPQEVRRLLAAAPDNFARAILTTAALSGARRGEITGLRWEDIDFEAHEIRIRRTLQWVNTGPRGEYEPKFFRPKTRSGRRNVPMAEELERELKRWKLACPPNQLNLVFPDAGGGPIRNHAVGQCFAKAQKKARLRQIRFHDLRHSFASALITNGVPLNEVASYLGHRDPTITLKVYTHFQVTKRTESIDRLAAQVFGASEAKA